MKITFAKPTVLLLITTLILSCFAFPASAADPVTAPELGSSSTFGLLANTMTTVGTTVHGDVGAITQTVVPTITNGGNHVNDSEYTAASIALGAAIADAKANPTDITGAAGADLGGLILAPRVYDYPGAVNIGSDITLSGAGVYIFKIAGTLNTAANTKIVLSDGAQSCNIFWVVDGATTLAANTDFKGNLLSPSSATTVGINVVIDGRILSQNAVTFTDPGPAVITVPSCATTSLPVPPVPIIPTVTPVPSSIMQSLVITSLCTENPKISRNWNVHNPNATQVVFGYNIEGSTQVGNSTINGNSDLVIRTNTEATNKLNILVNGISQASLISTGESCVTLPTKPTVPTAPTVPIVPAVPIAATCSTEAPLNGKLISQSTSLNVWLMNNGNLVINASLPDKVKGTGAWNFNLGGKDYSVEGNECISFIISDAPVGTYSITALFSPQVGASNNLTPVTVTVPTVTGGQLPETATPWYNLLLLGAALILIAMFIWRRKRHYE
jgi:LPXTG-motif cell wall-anchored protein